MKKLLSITLLIIAVSLGSCKEESSISRIEKGTTKKVNALSYTFNPTQNEDSGTVKSGNSTDSTKVVSPIERKVLSIDTLEIGGETFIASLIEENDLIETKATNPQVVESASVYTFYAYKGSEIKSQTIGTSNTTLFVPQDEATKYGIIFLSSAEGMEKPKQLTSPSIDGSSKKITYEAKFNENVCYASFDKVTMPPGNPIDVTFTPVFSQLGISVPSKVGERSITVKEVKLESGVQETANVVVTYNSEEVPNIKVDYAKVATPDYTPILECVPNTANDATILKGDYYNIIPNENDAKVKITMLLSGTPETTKSHTIDFKKGLEKGKRYTISLTNKVPISIELEDLLNIEPGQKGTLTAKVKMSDGTTETIETPTTGFTWVINSPNGVVTSTKGGVVVLGSDENIVTGNTTTNTTNTLSLTANANYYGSTTVTVTYGGESATAKVNVYRNIPISSYYEWDAWEHYDINNWDLTQPWGPGSPTYNPTKSGTATKSCANAPTLEQLMMYLGAGVYLVEDGPPFKLPNNEIYRAGLIVKKSANITDFNAGTAPMQVEVTPKEDFSKDETINKSDYFFLPACGSYWRVSFNLADNDILYWSSTSLADNARHAYSLKFDSGSAYVTYDARDDGFVPMVGFDPTYVPATVKDIIISPDPLNILPGEQGTLTATVTMSDGSNRTTGFTWEINSPSGVVTSTKGGVVVLGSDENIVTGNTTTNTTNTLSLTANANYYGSTTVTVTYGGESATAKVNVYRDIPETEYYMWDAYKPYDYANNPTGINPPWGPNSSGYNTGKDPATQSCKYAPTDDQMRMYLGAGVYWVEDGPPFKDVNGNIHRKGLLLMKDTSIPPSTVPADGDVVPKTGFSSDPNINNKSDYFFLPACGYYNSDSGSLLYAGPLGTYLSSTPDATNTAAAYYLYFKSGKAFVDLVYRGHGLVPMVGFDDSYVPATVEDIIISPDPLNILPGEQGTLTVTKVKMSDGSERTPTTDFTWEINPDGVVTSTSGGVESPSPRVVDGNSTTNIISLTAKQQYYGSAKVTVTYGGLSKTAKVNVYRDIPATEYYMWDAYKPYDYANNPTGTNPPWGPNSSGYNTITSGTPTQSCANAPTEAQMRMYLGAGVYWVEDGPPFKDVNGNIHRGGLLLKKYANIPASTAPAEGRVTPQTGFSTESSTFQTQHFFLSACGGYSTGSFYNAGTSGRYWLSTPNATATNDAYCLSFNSGYANVSYFYRNFGFVPMVGFDPTYVPATVEDIIISPDPLNILPGQSGVLTATVTMSDRSNRTSGFTWTINSPNGVVTSKDGGVVVLGSDKNIVTGSSTTNKITLTAGNYYGSTTVTVTYGGFSTTAKVNVYRNIPKTEYYMWDAYKPYDYANNPTGTNPPWGPNSSGYNTITSGTPTQSCANAPTEAQMRMYLGAGVYWVEDGPPFKLPNSTTVIHRKGLLLMKYANIPASTAPAEGNVTPKTDFSKESSTFQTQHFFLPPCGGYSSGSFSIAGASGSYWLSTPRATNASSACGLSFSSGSAYVGYYNRNYGFVPMPRL